MIYSSQCVVVFFHSLSIFTLKKIERDKGREKRRGGKREGEMEFLCHYCNYVLFCLFELIRIEKVSISKYMVNIRIFILLGKLNPRLKAIR